MSTAAYNGLLDFLCGTLTPEDMLRMGEQLIERAKIQYEPPRKPYTMDEINAMIDESEREIAAGIGFSGEEVFRELEEEIQREEAEEMAKMMQSKQKKVREPEYEMA